MWRDNKTGEVVERHDQIRALRPMSSLPFILDEAAIEFADFSPVTRIVPPFDPLTQKAVPTEPVLNDGQWEQVMEIVDLYDTPALMAAALAQAKTAAINQAYADVDDVTFAAVGNRTDEYKYAETVARDFVASGYAGTVDEVVSTYAQYNPTGEEKTPAWAADEIIARADAFRVAQKSMRIMRFTKQSQMRSSTTFGELQTAIDTWKAVIAVVRAQIGV